MIPQLSIVRGGGVPLLLQIVRMCVHALSSVHTEMGRDSTKGSRNILAERRASSKVVAMSPARRISRQQQLEQWELAHSDHGRLFENALGCLEQLATYRDDNPPPLIAPVPGLARSALDNGITVLVDALQWSSVFVEEYGSRRHELAQLSILKGLYEVASDFEAKSQLKAHRSLFTAVLGSASEAADAAATVDDAGVAEERHYARVVVNQATRLLRRLS